MRLAYCSFNFNETDIFLRNSMEMSMSKCDIHQTPGYKTASTRNTGVVSSH